MKFNLATPRDWLRVCKVGHLSSYLSTIVTLSAALTVGLVGLAKGGHTD